MAVTIEEKIKQGRQYRSMLLECRDAKDTDSYIVEGYATTYNEPYTLYSWDDLEFREIIDSHAFDKCDISDVIMQYDHEGRVFARTKNGTLTLASDTHGLKVVADLGGTSEGHKLYEEIKGGYTSKMSFGFIVGADETLIEEKNGKTVYTRTIKEIKKLFDVSAVSIPANDATEISARSFLDGVIEAKKLEQEKRAAEEKQKEKDIEQDKRRRAAVLLSWNLSK